MTDETGTEKEKQPSKAELRRAEEEAPKDLKEARAMVDSTGRKEGDRRTDHLAGGGPRYGEVNETGAEAFSRQHENATGKHVAEIGVPTSSLDTRPLADIKGVLPQTGASMPVIGEVQEEVATSGAYGADAETAGVGANADEKAAMRGSLPDDFPGVEKLRAEGLTSYGALRKYRGRFTQIDGIGEATEAKIREAAGLGDSSSDDDKEKVPA